MIRLTHKGTYRLIETQGPVKILYLDDAAYAWIHAPAIGELLVASHTPHRADHLLAVGRFRLYDVEAESGLANEPHLELLAGEGQWQGYLLPAGLPTPAKPRCRLIATSQCITAPQRV